MVAEIRHPYEDVIQSALRKARNEGTAKLTEAEQMAVGFHWLAGRMGSAPRPRRSPRQTVGLAGGALAALGAFGGGIGVGIVQALSALGRI